MFEKNNVSKIRTARGKCSNNYGYKMIEFCKENNFYILNGRSGYDKSVGGTTCRGISCIDYFLSNVSIFNYCSNFCVEQFCPLLSDVHNPVSLKLVLKENSFITSPSKENEINTKADVISWNNDCAEKFVDAIDILMLREIESKLDNLITNDFSKSGLDLIVHDISRLFWTARKQHSAKSLYHSTVYISQLKIIVNPGTAENVRKHGRNLSKLKIVIEDLKQIQTNSI